MVIDARNLLVRALARLGIHSHFCFKRAAIGAFECGDYLLPHHLNIFSRLQACVFYRDFNGFDWLDRQIKFT